MYGATRYLYENKIQAGMLTPDSQYPGVVTGALKTGTGSAAMTTGGTYAGSSILIYTVVIDSVSGGTEVGQATYKWRETSMAEGVWGATGVTTSASMSTLNHSVEIAFTSGSGDDFAVNDQWVFRAIPTFGIDNVLNLSDRGTFFRSGLDTTSVNIVCDLGAATAITAFVCGDHNLTDTATITLEANTTDSWGSPAYTQAVTLRNLAYLYLNESYRYWRVVVNDSMNATGYIEIGLLYAGEFLELTHNADWGAEHNLNFSVIESLSAFGVRRNLVNVKQETFALTYSMISTADIDTLRSMALSLHNATTGRVSSLLLHLFSDEAEMLFVVLLRDGIPRTYQQVNLHTVTLNFDEVVIPRV